MSAQRSPARDDDWLVVDPDEELEGVVRGFRSGDVGMSLVQDHAPVRGTDEIGAWSRHSGGVGETEEEVRLRAELTRLQQQMLALTQDNQSLRTECAQLSHTVRQSKEILAKYVHEKEVLERSAVDAEEVSTVSVQFLSATERRVKHIATRSSQLRHRLQFGEDNSKEVDLDAEMHTPPRTFETAVMSMETSVSELECEFGALGDHLTRSLSGHRQRADATYKISLTSFHEGDLALFFPTPHGDFLAFNAACPHHYLSEESKALIGQDKHFRKFYVLGKIVYMEAMTATATDNPFKLPVGTVYHAVSVTSVTQLIEKRNP